MSVAGNATVPTGASAVFDKGEGVKWATFDDGDKLMVHPSPPPNFTSGPDLDRMF